VLELWLWLVIAAYSVLFAIKHGRFIKFLKFVKCKF